MKRAHLPLTLHLRDREVGSSLFLAVMLAIVLILAFTSLAGADITTSIRNSPHNLSAAGPGAIRSSNEKQICIFCHTPHNATPVQPLWNRSLPTSAYRVYASDTLHAKPGQPTGSSKLCLSCHDGTIAIGSVNSRNQPIQMAGGITTLPPGRTNLGTDLSDDHPISFRYDSQLVSINSMLKDPGTLPTVVQLDSNKELQCTSCHSAHDDSRGNFLVMDNSNSQLCNSCHISQTATVVGHEQCADCHQNHTAPSGAHLLRAATVTDTCNLCHGGGVGTTSVAMSAAPAARVAGRAPAVASPAMAAQSAPPIVRASSVAQDMRKLSRHDADTRITLFATPVSANTAAESVNCADCHGSHSIKKGSRTAPNLPGTLGRVSGVTASGATIATARFEYEVCFKCHADRSTDRAFVSRQKVQPNKRLQFDPSAVSFHPVESRGRNPNVPSLSPNYTPSSIIYCTDCHSSDTSRRAGGAGPDGPHGSDNRPLLIARYDTTDFTSESATAYALCYRCHERSSILSNQSFPLHSRHIVNNRTPCSVCHDGHGIASVQGTTMTNAHLMNFDTAVVRPDPVTHRLEYRQQGPGRGQCYLLCHGKAHSPLSY